MNYPFGEEITSTNNDTFKFAQTYRDSDSGLDYAMSRYYASSIGRFLSGDKLHVNPDPSTPQGWNRYAYANGNPVNRFDPGGKDSCFVDLLTGDMGFDAGGCDDPCDPDEDVCLDPSNPVGSPIAPTPTPTPSPAPQQCWQNTSNISSTLNNLGTDIEADAKSDGFSGADLTLLTGIVNSDITTEMAAIGPGGTTSSPYYVGGRFNLDIQDSQITTQAGFSTADVMAFGTLFGGTSQDGVRQPAQTGLAAALGYTLHSQNGKDLAGSYNFHFDIFNPKRKFGIIGHFFGEVIGGHPGNPCLDPAWK